MKHSPRSFFLLCCALSMASAAGAQVSTGSLSGTILDPAGAAVPGAKVEARHEQSGSKLETMSSDAGVYVFPHLPVGLYTISVEKVGFKKLSRPQIEIRVAQRQSLDLRLEVGDVQQTVEVTGVAPLLDTTLSERGQNFAPRFMDTLPLFAGGIRNPEAFIAYMPGVNFGFGETSISGSGGRAKEVLIDGASQTIPESGGVVFNFPASEQFGEFKLITDTFSAEYGRFGGGVEVFITKSGTNALHGGAFWNIRRDVFNAAGWTVNQNTRNPRGFRPKERFNEIGGVIGGPVYIPRIYDGRNKTFFFFTYVTDQRPATIGSTISGVPTARMKQGDFSEAPQEIYDPATTARVGNTVTRQLFPNKQIPRQRFSRVSANLLAAIPDPNVPGITNNFAFVNTSALSDDIWSLKFDHAFTSTNRLAVYLNFRDQDIANVTALPGPLGQGLGSNSQRPQNYRLNHDYVFRPNLLLHSTFGFTRQQQGWDNPAQKGFGSRIGLPLSGIADATPRICFGLLCGAGSPVGADGLTHWGVPDGKVANGTQFNWTFHFSQGLTWLRGKHEFKMGWDFRRLRTFAAPADAAGTNGRYVFSRAQTADPARLAQTGHSFASLLLGLPDQADQTALPLPDVQIRYGYQAFYFQDNWKVTPNLTLNLGLRYDVPIGFHDAKGGFTSLDPDKPNPGADNYPGALVYAGSGPGRVGKLRFYPTDFSEVGPRVGFAYRLTSRTVLRGGFGIYYQTLGNGGCGCREGFSAVIPVVSNGVDPAFPWENGVPVPAGFQPPPFIDPSFANGRDMDYVGPTFGQAPRFYNWSFSVQREIKNFLVDLAYVGNRGRRLNSTIEMNQVAPSRLSLGALLQRRITDPEVVARGFRKPYPSFPDTGTLAQALRPFPQYLAISDRNSARGKIWYDALQARVERRFGSWQMMTAYTWSKTLAVAHYRQIFSQSQVQAQDNYNLDEMKSFSHFDQPHVLNILNSWDLPFGGGRKFLSSRGRAVDLLVGGWTIAGAQRYVSGNLIQLTAPNTLGLGVLFTRFKKANRTDVPIRTSVDRTSLDPNNPNIRWFNAGAFTIPGQFEFGNAATFHSEFRNPPVFTENLAILKNIGIWESVRLQYRADFFNLFNRTNFGAINGIVGNANFGRAQGVQVGPRIITMGFRLDF